MKTTLSLLLPRVELLTVFRTSSLMYLTHKCSSSFSPASWSLNFNLSSIITPRSLMTLFGSILESPTIIFIFSTNFRLFFKTARILCLGSDNSSSHAHNIRRSIYDFFSTSTTIFVTETIAMSFANPTIIEEVPTPLGLPLTPRTPFLHYRFGKSSSGNEYSSR